MVLESNHWFLKTVSSNIHIYGIRKMVSLFIQIKNRKDYNVSKINTQAHSFTEVIFLFKITENMMFI